MRRFLGLLGVALWLLAFARIGMAEPAPLHEGDFSVALPGGTFDMIAGTREDLERVSGQAFERFEEFPNLGIVYDRIITDAVNFFADEGESRIHQMNFKEGGVTARGIGLGSTQAEVLAAYGEAPFWFNEHGCIRAEYGLTVGGGDYELLMVINASKDRVTDLHMNGPRSGERRW